MIAELLIGLPAGQLGEVIVGLTPGERARIAQLLVNAEHCEGRPKKEVTPRRQASARVTEDAWGAAGTARHRTGRRADGKPVAG